MLDLPQTDPLEKLVGWAEAHPSIRAMILTSSQARPQGTVDLLSDYDVILAVTDADHFAHDDAWIAHYGEPMVRWGDQHEIYDVTTYFRGVIYEDSVKFDYTVWPVALLDLVSAADELLDELDAGYRVLLDKDGQTAGWKSPTYRAFIPLKPTADEYRALVEEFWWDATYVAKSLWRNELIFAKWNLDCDIKTVALRRMLEWRVEIDHDWALRPGVLGRGLERLLTGDTWLEMADTYVGVEIEANWEALFRTTVLFRRVAKEVGAALGYTYPQRVDDQVSAYLEAIRQLPPPGAS